MTESAREEALRLVIECGWHVSPYDPGGKIKFNRIDIESLIRLIALARHRPGWKWVPEFPLSEVEKIVCPVCGYYCLGKGGHGCIDKPALLAEVVAVAPKPEDTP